MTIRLDLDPVRVSYVLALLRVVQAAVREVARSDDEARQRFDRSPQPVLLLTGAAADSGLTLGFAFADPLDGGPRGALTTPSWRSAWTKSTGSCGGVPGPPWGSVDAPS